MSGPSTVHTRSLTRRSALGIVALALVMPSVCAFAQTPAILVHKDPDCGCCAGWAQHVKDAGFAVTVEETTDLQPVKKRLGVPADLAACHTAEVGGYTCWRGMSRRRPSDDCWKNDRPRSDWPSQECPPGHREWRVAHLGGMTSFSSEQLADNPLFSLSAQKMPRETSLCR